jgi:hypothetical protein
MPSLEYGQNLILSGLWHGQFTYPTAAPPEFFTANLQERPEFLRGSTREVSRFGWSLGQTLYATIFGRRQGRDIMFTKVYDGRLSHHCIQYAGCLSADNAEIEGVWRVPGKWSGQFLMIRDAEAAFVSCRTAIARRSRL